MDEPLSNLDALLRLEMRVTLKELQVSLGETFVYVTHDQVEALSMGDRIAVLNMGVLQQVDDPETIYRFPKNTFVATILGNPPMQFLRCSTEKIAKGMRISHPAFSIATEEPSVVELIAPKGRSGNVILGLRPEDIRIFTEEPEEKAINAEIYVTEPLGNETVVDVRLGENVIKVLAAPDFIGKPGQKIWINFNCSKLHLFDDESHLCVHHASEESGFRLD
jgi:multiple sugar transport system ATP-binding protein